jgi:hypothetical protein
MTRGAANQPRRLDPPQAKAWVGFFHSTNRESTKDRKHEKCDQWPSFFCAFSMNFLRCLRSLLFIQERKRRSASAFDMEVILNRSLSVFNPCSSVAHSFQLRPEAALCPPRPLRFKKEF